MKKAAKGFMRSSDGTITMIAGVNLLLAAAALVRDILLALSLGTTADADAFVLAFSVPDIFANNVFAVSAAMAAVPLLTGVLMNKGEKGFARTSKTLVLAVMSTAFIIFVAGMIFRNGIIDVIGRGLDPDTASLANRLLLIMMPAVLFFPLYTLGASVLNVKNSFLLPSSAPVVFNLVYIAGIIAGMLLFREGRSLVMTISFSVVAGVAVMAAMVWAGIVKKGLITPGKDLVASDSSAKKDLKEYLRILLPYLLIYSAGLSVLFAERFFASSLEVGTIAGLNYAYRISQLPTWVFIAALGTYALPTLSRMNGKNSRTEQNVSIIRHLKTTLLISIPFSAAIYFLREPIVEVLLSRGAFDMNSGKITSGILAGYALAIVGQGIIFICLRFFLSMRYVMYPAAVVILASVLNIVADAVLVKHSGYVGLGAGAAIGAAFGGIVMLILINVRTGGLVIQNATQFLKIIAACLIMIPFVAGLRFLWFDLPIMFSPWLKFGYLCLAFMVSGLVYLGGLKILRYRNNDRAWSGSDISGGGDHSRKG